MTTQYTHITKILDGSMSLGRSHITNGSLTVNGGAIPPAMTIDYNAGTVQWSDQSALGAPGPYTFTFTHKTPDEVRAEKETYRDKRQRDYIAQFSIEGTFERSLGDAIDALIDFVYGDTTALDALKAKRDAIKASYPKT